MSDTYPGLPGQGRLLLGRLATGTRIVVTVAYVFIVGLWAGGLALTESFGHPIGAIVAMYAVDVTIFTLLAVWQITWVFRTSAWLEGSTLALRGAFRTKRCDLSVSRVWLNTTMRGFPRLNARDAQTGRRVRLPLGRPYHKSIRTPPKLMALADAIMAGGQQDPDAMRVAGSLRGWAAPPVGYSPAGYPSPDPYHPRNV